MKPKYFLILSFVILLAENYHLLAQSSSSYSRYGIGDIDYSYSVRRMGMGQLGTAVADADFISIINPASLYKIDKTRFEKELDQLSQEDMHKINTNLKIVLGIGI